MPRKEEDGLCLSSGLRVQPPRFCARLGGGAVFGGGDGEFHMDPVMVSFTWTRPHRPHFPTGKLASTRQTGLHLRFAAEV